MLDGFRGIHGNAGIAVLELVALTGLVASFHTILYAKGRQVYSLSRAGYFPTALSVNHHALKTPHVAMIAGSIAGLAVMLAIWFALGAEQGGAAIGSVLLNMAVFGAMLSYILQAVSFILLRRNQPGIERPFRSPLGGPSAAIRRDRAPDHALPGPGPEFRQGRALGDRLVRGRDPVFRPGRPPSTDPLAGGGVRSLAPG